MLGFNGKHIIDLRVNAKSFEITLEEGTPKESYSIFGLSFSSLALNMSVWKKGMSMEVTKTHS